MLLRGVNGGGEKVVQANRLLRLIYCGLSHGHFRLFNFISFYLFFTFLPILAVIFHS